MRESRATVKEASIGRPGMLFILFKVAMTLMRCEFG